MTQRQLQLSELLLNSSVASADEEKLTAQAQKVWQLFCPNGDSHYAEVWTSQLRAAAAQYMSRLTEIRYWLLSYGLTIDNVGSNGRGNHKYRVVGLSGSHYEKRLRRRGIL